MLYTKEELQMAEKNGNLEELYGEMVNDCVCKKYSFPAQISLLRQKDKKPDEYATFFDFAEQCKTEIKDYIVSCGCSL